MTLYEKNVGDIFKIKDIVINDKELEEFLFTLGCYKGKEIVLINKKRNNVIISIKGARYSVDKHLALKIMVED